MVVQEPIYAVSTILTVTRQTFINTVPMSQLSPGKHIKPESKIKHHFRRIYLNNICSQEPETHAEACLVQSLFLFLFDLFCCVSSYLFWIFLFHCLKYNCEQQQVVLIVLSSHTFLHHCQIEKQTVSKEHLLKWGRQSVLTKPNWCQQLGGTEKWQYLTAQTKIDDDKNEVVNIPSKLVTFSKYCFWFEAWMTQKIKCAPHRCPCFTICVPLLWLFLTELSSHPKDRCRVQRGGGDAQINWPMCCGIVDANLFDSARVESAPSLKCVQEGSSPVSQYQIQRRGSSFVWAPNDQSIHQCDG